MEALFYKSLIKAREMNLNKKAMAAFVKAFDNAANNLVEEIPAMKNKLLSQAANTNNAVISTDFAVNMNSVFVDLDAGMEIKIHLPPRYNYSYITQKNQITFYASDISCFSRDEEHDMMVKYLCEFIPEISKIKKIISTHFTGPVQVVESIVNSGKNVLFNFQVSYNIPSMM